MTFLSTTTCTLKPPTSEIPKVQQSIHKKKQVVAAKNKDISLLHCFVIFLCYPDLL